MTRRTLWGQTTVLTVAFIMALNCGGRQDHRGKTLEFWTVQLSPMFDDYMHELITHYEADHPGIKVRWIDVPYDATVQKLLAALAAEEPPDAVNLSADFLPQFIGMNALANLDEFIGEESRREYLPAAWHSGQGIRPGSYAVPWYLSTYITIYNKALFAKAGLTEKDVPRTFRELLALARQYKELTGRFLFFFNLSRESFLPLVLGSEGVSMVTSDLHKAAFNSPEGLAVLQPWVQLYREGYLPREAITEGHRKAIELYQSGEVALMIGGPQFLKLIRENAPNIYATTDVAPAIVGATGRHSLAMMGISVLRASRLKAEAVDFALYATNAENQLRFCKQVAILPSVHKALKDPLFSQTGGDLEMKARSLSARQLASAEVLQPPLRDSVRLYQIFGEAIQKACLGEKSLEAALQEAAATWDRILQAEA